MNQEALKEIQHTFHSTYSANNNDDDPNVMLSNQLEHLFSLYGDRIDSLNCMLTALNVANLKLGNIDLNNGIHLKLVMKDVQSLLSTIYKSLYLTTRLLDEKVTEGKRVKEKLIQLLDIEN